MASRYDYMGEGKTRDAITGSYYPDPLTLKYDKLELTSVPLKDVMSTTKIKFLWKEAQSYYGNPHLDDMVLTLNGVPHKNFLKPKDILYFPTEEDIQTSFSKGRK